MTIAINKFDGEHSFLSNFFPSAISDGTTLFPTVEHFFQAAKTDSMQDYLQVGKADTPGKAKHLGRIIHLRGDWEQVKDNIMLAAVREKFAIPELKALLIATGDKKIIEGNYWHDNYWGVCDCATCGGIRGRNKLGEILMQVREEVK